MKHRSTTGTKLQTQRLLGGLASAAILVGLSACDDRHDEAETSSNTTTVEDVREHPRWYEGKKVTLSGEVDEVYSARSFELEGNADLFDTEVLVVTKSDVALGGTELRDDDDVVVRGVVRRFVTADVEKELGWDLPLDVETQWSKKAVVVASSVSRIDEYARWEEDDEDGAALVSVMSVYYYPEPIELAGTSLELDSVPIREVSKQGVWVGHNALSSLYVSLSDEQLKGLSVDDRVDIDGTIREFPKGDDVARDWELSESQVISLQVDGVYIEGKTVEKQSSGQRADAR